MSGPCVYCIVIVCEWKFNGAFLYWTGWQQYRARVSASDGSSSLPILSASPTLPLPISSLWGGGTVTHADGQGAGPGCRGSSWMWLMPFRWCHTAPLSPWWCQLNLTDQWHKWMDGFIKDCSPGICRQLLWKWSIEQLSVETCYLCCK